MNDKEYRAYIESDESVDEILEHGQEVEIRVAPPNKREVRITVRLKGEEIEAVDRLSDLLGVGRSTAMKIAVRMATKGVVISGPLVLGRLSDGDESLSDGIRVITLEEGSFAEVAAAKDLHSA